MRFDTYLEITPFLRSYCHYYGETVIILYVNQSDLKDLQEVFTEEGVTFEERQTGTVRELNTGNWPVFQVQANLPEVKVPPEYSQGDIGARAFRLPSGKLIITDLEGSMEQITIPVPRKA